MTLMNESLHGIGDFTRRQGLYFEKGRFRTSQQHMENRNPARYRHTRHLRVERQERKGRKLTTGLSEPGIKFQSVINLSKPGARQKIGRFAKI